MRPGGGKRHTADQRQESPAATPGLAVELRGVRRQYGRGAGAVHALMRRRPRPAARDVHRDHGAVRVRQVHLPPVRRRARPAVGGVRAARWHGDHRDERERADRTAPQPPGLRLPGLQPAALADRGAERPAAPAPRRKAPGPSPGGRGARTGRARRQGAAEARRAVRRPAAAGGRGPGPGDRPRRGVRRRAHRGAGHRHRRRGPGAAPARRRHRRGHRRHGHPRPGGGRLGRPGAVSRRRRLRRGLERGSAERIAEHMRVLTARTAGAGAMAGAAV